MTRKPRRPPYLQGHYYHIYNRGVSRANIFREDNNYLFVLNRIKKYSKEFQLSLIAYCLMPNHYHFLVRQDGQLPAGSLPQRVFNSYTKAYNKRYGHSGTLFEGSYKVVETANESHLLHLCRYIHANPVKGGVVKNLEDWPFSNYMEWIGKRAGTLVDHDFIAAFFVTADDYQEFVEDYLNTRDLPLALHQYLEDY
jgi:REP element-mobilizing transposase RayT